MSPLRPTHRPALLVRAARRPVTSLRVAALAALSSLFFSASAGAETPPDYVFDAVDSYRIYAATLYITGVQRGQAAPTSITAVASSSSGGSGSCERALIQMVNRPGRLTLSLYGANGSNASCAVTRNP